MRIHLAVLAVLAVSVPAGAQSLSRIVNVEARRTTSLNGKWRAIVDPYENGYYDFRLQPSKDGYFLDAKPKDKSDLLEYNFDTSGQLDVPGDSGGPKNTRKTCIGIRSGC